MSSAQVAESLTGNLQVAESQSNASPSKKKSVRSRKKSSSKARQSQNIAENAGTAE